MIIESLIRRKGGTRVDMNTQVYHFKPSPEFPKGEHVANVTDENHIARFIGITEGFREASAPAKPRVGITAPAQVLHGEGGAGTPGGSTPSGDQHATTTATDTSAPQAPAPATVNVPSKAPTDNADTATVVRRGRPPATTAPAKKAPAKTAKAK